ncbi:MAG TPA: UDP-N-acetylmuramoyl-L-alanyl-D-glutamate--2,6-diaminopimelate ligase [Candidatus Baltobacteraceae bacterium]|nr:UDP-N-acetylmuramoyl-L-alanyl-D-glutamate--2,6-diaminopimelate ligase [Candidatus Baltobacteraceae bacterium]
MEQQVGVSLESLVRTLAQSARVIGPQDKTVTSITVDSREVRPGALFVALRGEHTDGHRFIGDAVSRGCEAVVMERLEDLRASASVPAHVTAVIVPDSARALSQIADAFYGSPSRSLTIAGITGTNGKTTTAAMTAAIMNASGMAAGTIGTIGAKFGRMEWPLANTTPLAAQLHDLLAQMRALGANGVAMEVSSHALSLQRVADVRFSAGALTNVTRDHLDFHKSFDAYASAKHRLFDMAPRCVFNADDALGDRWSRELRSRKPVLTYGIDAAADLHPDSIEMRTDGSTFQLGAQRFEVHLPGRFNVSNALCALGIARHLDISDADSARGLACLERVPGRMDRVSGGGIDVIVDYAHTPDALENLLRTLRETARGRLLVVFGCGGDRDRGKRPQMGNVAARYADLSFVTSDNPRTEEPQAIIDEILPGIGSAPHEVCADRRAAIDAAVSIARPGDVVAIAGKGHEAYQIIGTQVLPFDDLAVAREVLARREAASR